jgi:uncharacterized membrane protein YdjX (TVP38/TMEM64 family)
MDRISRKEPAIESAKRPQRVWIRALILVAIVVGLILLLNWTGLVRLFLDRERAIQFIQKAGPWGFAVFLLLQIAQVVAAPIPGEVVSFLGGYLYGPVLGTVLSAVGLTLGSLLAFGLARVFGRPLVQRFVDEKTIARFDFLLRPQGTFLVSILFLIPGFPKDYLCYILGLGHLSFARFTVIVATGRLLGTVMLTVGGDLLREGEYDKLFVLAAAAVVALVVALAYRDRLERWVKARASGKNKQGRPE